MRFHPALRASLAISMLAFGTGCTSLLGRQDTRPDEIAELKARVVELQRQVTVHEIEISRLKNLSNRPPAPSTPASVRPTAEPESGAESSFDLPTRPSPSFESSDLPAEAPPTEAGGNSIPATVAGRSAVGEQAMYEAAYGLLRERRYEEAEIALKAFLRQYPETDLSDNAAYWVGESLYSRGEFQHAFEAFRQTVERYPEGNKLPDAMLKVGLCLIKTGDRVGARDVLEEVSRRFPATAAAATAAATLQDLR
jgi:tol-pal system protein YbgF